MIVFLGLSILSRRQKGLLYPETSVDGFREEGQVRGLEGRSQPESEARGPERVESAWQRL